MAPDHDFEEGDLCVHAPGSDDRPSSGARPVTVFRVTQVRDSHKELKGEVIWTNNPVIDEELSVVPPMSCCELLEGGP